MFSQNDTLWIVQKEDRDGVNNILLTLTRVSGGQSCSRAQIKIWGQLKSNLTVVTLFLILQLLSYTVPSLLIVCSWAIQSDIWPRKVSMGCWCAEDKTITIILFWGSSPSDWSWGKTTVWEKYVLVWEKRTKLGPNQLPVEVEQSKRTRCMLYCCIRELCTARLNKCITNGDGQKIPETRSLSIWI